MGLLDSEMFAGLRLPLVAAPMFLVTGPEIVIAACKAGIMAGAASASARSNGWSLGWLAKRMKYQLESTNVSSVSVSRSAGWLQPGQATCFQVGCRSSGFPGVWKSTSSGSTTGSWSLGTGTTPQAAQWMNGIGVPQ